MTAYDAVRPIVFVDTETTGLDPECHVPWEVALIDAEGTDPVVWVIDPTAMELARADPTALRICRFWERRDPVGMTVEPAVRMRAGTALRMSRRDACWEIAQATANKHLVGAVPSFDAAMLDHLLRRHGAAPAWHYHLVDVEAMAAAVTGLQPPWSSRELTEALGVEETPAEELHTALGDARWAKRMYEAVWERQENRTARISASSTLTDRSE